MNALAQKYGSNLNILAFPCNQFGHQTNESNSEFLSTLANVRPGNGFQPAPQIVFFEKGDVNGSTAQPVYKWLRTEVMLPKGDKYLESKERGCADMDHLSSNPIWTPVCRSDIAWNFEKFLVNAKGEVVERYHRYFLIGDIAEDIDKLL